MNTTTLIFDLDGTLLNTLDDLHASVCHALRQLGLPAITCDDARRYVGNGVRRLVELSVAQVAPQGDPSLTDRAFSLFRAHYANHSADHTAPYEGVAAMLRQCRDMGYRSAIVTNKPDAAARELHAKFFAPYIDTVIGETPDMARKPAPDMVREAIRRLSLLAGQHIPDSECVYIGDSEVDLLTARNAGLRCIAVAWGYRDRDFLVSQGAETVADTPAALPALIKKQ